MKALEVIQDAVDPKRFIMGRREVGPLSPERVEAVLIGRGFKFQQAPGKAGGYWWKERYPIRMAVWLSERQHTGWYADIIIFRWLEGPTHLEREGMLTVLNMENLVSILRDLGFWHVTESALDVIEAIDPKRFHFHGRFLTGNVSGRPDIAKVTNALIPRRAGWEYKFAVGGGYFQRLANGKHYVVWPKDGLVVFRTYYWDADHWALADEVEFDNMGDLIKELHRNRMLESVLDLDPATGKVRYDPKKPKAPHSIWTYQRLDPDRNPNPYVRNVRLHNGKPMEIIAAFHKDKAPLDLLKAVKLYPAAVATVAKKGADHIAWALMPRSPIDMVMAMPSSKPLAQRFAKLLAGETGAEFAAPISKTKEIKGIPILKRLGAAKGAFSVQGRYRGKTIVLVDDYIVTASSMIAAATELYKAGAKRVIGAALAV